MILRSQILKVFFSLGCTFPVASTMLLIIFTWWESGEIKKKPEKRKYIPKRLRAPNKSLTVSDKVLNYISARLGTLWASGLRYLEKKCLNFKFEQLNTHKMLVHKLKCSSPCARPFRLRQIKFKNRGMELTQLLMHRETGDSSRPLAMANSLHPRTFTEYTTLMARENEGAIQKPANTVLFDTDSVPIRVDSGCSISVSGTKKDFLTHSFKAVAAGTVIKGYGGTTSPITHTATLSWKVLDDDGIARELRIPNSLYVPTCTTRLLSPQHFAQEREREERSERSRKRAGGCQACRQNLPCAKHETKCVCYRDKVELIWNKGRCRKTVALDRSNIGTMYTAPGYNKWHAFCTT
jgi:hypothetical protein